MVFEHDICLLEMEYAVILSKTPAASTAGPFLPFGTFVEEKSSQKGRKIDPETWKIEAWRGSGRSWGRPLEEKCPGGCLGRFWPILDRRGEPKMAARWANLAARWGQDGAKMAQDRVWLAILRPVGELSWVFLGVLGPIFAKMAEV